MKYLVHETTKQHVIWEQGMPTSAPGYKCVEADDEGWIPWSGGECPLPDDCAVRVKIKGHEYGEDFADVWNWSDYGLTAYRPILESAEKVQTEEEWNGYIDADDDSASVFDRLKSAIAASESIPGIIAEIDALLPDGYCVAQVRK